MRRDAQAWHVRAYGEHVAYDVTTRAGMTARKKENFRGGGEGVSAPLA